MSETSAPSTGLSRVLGLGTGVGVVVANMVGSGIFTTTGFIVVDVANGFWVLSLWALGGLLALSGALAYAELGAAFPSAGGEYVYLREAYGRSVAFTSFVVSITAGFSAPIAASLKSVGHYASAFVPRLSDESPVVGALSPNDLFAVAILWLVVWVHTRRVDIGMGVTGLFAGLKVLSIVALVVAVIASSTWAFPIRPELEAPDARSLPALATSLVFVMFAYSGWNAAAYLGAELREPRRNLPRALLLGTGVVTVLYLALNAVYLTAAPRSAIAGKPNVAQVVAEYALGPTGALLVSGVLVVALTGSAVAMIAVAPRVYYALGKDFTPLAFMAKTDPSRSTPRAALIVQGAVGTAFIAAGRIDEIQQYAGLTLSLFATLAVAAASVLRVRRPDQARPYCMPAYPLPVAVFCAVSVLMMGWAALQNPGPSLAALGTVVLAWVAFVGHGALTGHHRA